MKFSHKISQTGFALIYCFMGGLTARASDQIQSRQSGGSARTIPQSVSRLGFSYKPTPLATPATFDPIPALDAILMPQFTVEESWKRLTPKDLLSSNGAMELAKKLYISPVYSITVGPLAEIAKYINDPLSLSNGWHPNESESMLLYKQEERLEKLSDLDSLISLEIMDNPRDKKKFQEIQSEAAESSR